MTPSRVEANRAAKTARIKDVARTCLAKQGPAALSLREVAREMNETSSALYRYFANRDALLTALILDAYNDIGVSAERAVDASADQTPINRLVAIAQAIRTWALDHPHEYALVFGSPIPNYEAPDATIGPATRIPRALASVVDAPLPRTDSFGLTPIPVGVLHSAGLNDVLPHSSPDAQARALLLWSSIFGLLNFEIFGHFVGSVEDASDFFDRAIYDLGLYLGMAG